MKKHSAEHLLQKYLDGQCSPEEAAIVEAAYDLNIIQNPVYPTQQTLDDVTARSWAAVSERVRGKRDNLRWLPYAAALILVISAAVYFLIRNSENKSQPTIVLEDVAPGTNKAHLILANGTRLDIGSTRAAIPAQAGTAISQADDSTLVYSPSAGTVAIPDELQYNTLVTPRGGQFSIRLPDGSRVWLNAASSLTFPANFQRMASRRVKLSGEAYFEVAKDLSRPFIVETPTQQVQVLGTHFNINSYRDEEAVVTTLLEGSVSILAPNSSPKTLIPGQQAKHQNGTIEILPADDNAMAWKNGKISFQGSVQSIMRQVSRWYDVDVRFIGKIPEKQFSGEVYRNISLSSLLEIIEASGQLKFEFTPTPGRPTLTVKNRMETNIN